MGVVYFAAGPNLPMVLESLAWFYVLKSIRNEVMHADGFGNETERETFIRAFVDSGYSNGFDPQYDKAVKEGKSRLECNDALARDILAALAVLEARSTLRPVATSV